MIIEAEKFRDLPSVSERPQRASGLVETESEGLRTRRVNDVNPSPRAGKRKQGTLV